MNTRLPLAFINYWRRVSKNQGFAVPLALVIGFVLIVVGTTMLIKSQSNITTASAQKARTKGLSAAEMGLTRIQSLLNENRILTLYPSHCAAGVTDCWANIDPTQDAFAVTSGLPSFQKDLQKRDSVVCSDSAAENPQQTQTRLQEIVHLTQSAPNSIDSWEDLGHGYYYRLVSYNYVPAPDAVGNVPGTATVIVEGLSGSGDTEAVTRLKVQIPITRSDSPDTIPGLWLKDGGLNKLNGYLEGPTTAVDTNGQKFASNVYFSDCDNVPQTAANSIEANRIDPNSEYKTVERLNVAPPSIPVLSTTQIVEKYPDTVTLDPNELDFSGSERVVFPKPSEGVKEVYRYVVDHINISGSSSVTITPGAKVVFYVTGNISVQGSGGLIHDCTGNTSCKPTDFQIYGLAPDTTPDILTDDPTISLGGNNVLEAFILAPTYGGGIDGGAVIKGSLWVKTWSKQPTTSSNSNHTSIEQTALWKDLPTEIAVQIPALPELKAVSSWDEEAREP